MTAVIAFSRQGVASALWSRTLQIVEIANEARRFENRRRLSVDASDEVRHGPG
jgi:hypothetical protein